MTPVPPVLRSDCPGRAGSTPPWRSIRPTTNSSPYPFREITSATVMASQDGGLSWSTLGQQPLPPIRDLVLGIDGLNLFAATRTGVMRMPLG